MRKTSSSSASRFSKARAAPHSQDRAQCCSQAWGRLGGATPGTACQEAQDIGASIGSLHPSPWCLLFCVTILPQEHPWVHYSLPWLKGSCWRSSLLSPMATGSVPASAHIHYHSPSVRHVPAWYWPPQPACMVPEGHSKAVPGE